MGFVGGPYAVGLDLVPQILGLGRGLFSRTFRFVQSTFHFSVILFPEMVAEEPLNHDFFTLVPVVSPKIFHMYKSVLNLKFSGVSSAEIVLAENVMQHSPGGVPNFPRPFFLVFDALMSFFVSFGPEFDRSHVSIDDWPSVAFVHKEAIDGQLFRRSALNSGPPRFVEPGLVLLLETSDFSAIETFS